MADETINIAVQETGTLDVIQLLEKLGLTGYEATNRAAEGWVNYSRAQSIATNSEKIMAAAREAGVTNLNTLRTALDALTTQELASAAGTRRLVDLQKELANAYGTTARMAAEAAAAEQRAAESAASAALQSSRAAGRAANPSSFAGGGPAGSAATAPREASAASSFTDRANAATGQLAGFQAMTAGVSEAEKAVTRLHAANVTATGSLSRMHEGATAATSALSGLATAVGIYVTASAAIKASDEYTLIANQLHIATSSTAEFNDQYKILLATANASQTDFEAVVKLFARMQGATSGTAVSAQQLDKAVLGMAMGLRLSGTTAQETTRLMREMSEALAMGELKGRQLQSMLANSPIFMKQLGDAMGVNLFEGMTKSTKATVDYDEKMRNLIATHDQVKGSVTGLETKLKSETDTKTKSTAAWLALGEGAKGYQKGLDTYLKTQETANASIAKNTGLLGQARDAEDAKYAAEKKAIQNHIDAAQSLDTQTISTEKLIDGLVKMGVTTNGLEISQTTFGGALQVLHNQFVNLFRDGTDTNTWMTTLKGLILTLANNLETTIPIVFALGAAFVALKLVVLAGQIVEATAALAEFTAGAVAFIATPTGLAILGIAAAIAAVITATNNWGTVQNGLKTIVTSGSEAIKSTLKDVTAGYDDITKSANAAADAAKKVNDVIAAGKAMGITPDNNRLNSLYGTNTDLSATTDAQRQQGLQAAAFRDGGAFIPGGTGTDTVPVAFMVSPGERIVVQTPSQAAGHVPTPANDNGRAYASGGFWTPGTGFGVSLGSGASTAAITGGSVTGYTPAPLANSGMATGTGSLPGNSISGATTLGSASAGGADLQDVVGWDTITAATSRAYAVTTGVGAIKEIFDANFNDYGKAVEQLDHNFMIVAGQYKNALFDSNNNQIMGNKLPYADLLYNIATSTPILNNSGLAAFPMSTSAANTQQTPLQMAQAGDPVMGKLVRDFTQGTMDATDYSLLANIEMRTPWSGTGVSPGALGTMQTMDYRGIAALGLQASTSVQNTPTPGLSSSFGGISSTGQYNSGTLGYSDMGNTIKNVGAGGSYIPGTGIFKARTVSPNNGGGLGTQGFRDGGDILVPGGSGVDSQMMNLAVSPGESVHVRTPSQRAANGNNAPNQVNHFTTVVHAKDVDSFGQSQSQFAAGQMRMARRVARRVG